MFLLLFFFTELYASNRDNVSGEWELARKTEDVSIYYRWIVTDSLKTREMRAQFFIHAKIPAILYQFTEVKSYLSWAVGIKECRIQKVDTFSWVTYTLMDYPWPLKQKDLVTRHFVKRTNTETEILIFADPGFFEQKEGIERMQNYLGEWKFTTGGDGITKVDYRVVSYTKPVFPRFIQDPVIQKLFIDSFHELKQLAETR